MNRHERRTEAPMLRRKDVAEQCLVSERTVQRWIDAGDLVVHRLGRQVRISQDDFTTFLKTRRG